MSTPPVARPKHRSGAPTLTIRLPPSELGKLKESAAAAGEPLASFVRRLLTEKTGSVDEAIQAAANAGRERGREEVRAENESEFDDLYAELARVEDQLEGVRRRLRLPCSECGRPMDLANSDAALKAMRESLKFSGWAHSACRR